MPSLRMVVAIGVAIGLLTPLTEYVINGGDFEAWGAASAWSVALLAALATVACLKRWRGERRRGWGFVAGAAFSQAIGTTGFLLTIEVGGSWVWPTVWDVPLALVPVLMLVALWRHQRSFDLRAKVGFFLDTVLFALGAGFLVWEFFIAPGVGGVLSGGEQVLLAWRLFGSGLIASVLGMSLLVETSPTRWAMWVSSTVGLLGQVALAQFVMSNADAWYALLFASSLVSLFALAVSAATSTGPSSDDSRLSLIRLVLAAVPLACAVGLAVWRYLHHDAIASAGGVALAYAWGLAVLAAQVSSWVQSSSLTQRLERNVRSLRDREYDLQTLLDDLPTAVVVLSSDGRIHEANAGAIELTGRSEAMLQRMVFSELIPADELPRLVELWHEMLRGGEPWPPVFRFERPDGAVMYLEASIRTPIRDQRRIVIDLRDLTIEVERQHRLEQAQERFRMAFHDAPTGMAMARADDGVLVDVNESMLRMLGYRRHDFIGRTVQSITHPDDWEFDRMMLERSVDGDTEPYRMEKRFIRSDGSVLWAMVSVSTLDQSTSSPVTLAHVEDITERRRASERLEWAATHDALTRLPNRFRFLEQLTLSLQSATPGSVAVLFIDLDNFKVINDSLGHAAGDQLLRSMSERLSSVISERDMLGRFGGDEFIVLVRDVGADVQPLEVAERLRQEIAKPLVIDGGGELFVTASIGVAVAEADDTTTDLMRDADAAMYRAKARGRDCIEVFAPGSRVDSFNTLRTSTDLRRGLDRGEILPYFQPIVALDDGRLRGFEVLARWKHPERGLLGPEDFLPMAEEMGLVAEVGGLMMRESLAHLGMWQHRLPSFRDLAVSVNVSVRQLMNPDFPQFVAEVLAESGVAARSLWLEITETALMSDEKVATVAMRELRNLGLHLSVDDFGTGYSSLTYLKKYPLETIKVDRSFVNGFGLDPDDSSIVEAVVKLGHSLGMTVVAEGVETPLQLNRLRDVGCDFGQGYLFGRPSPAELVETEYSPV
jgi:diguanylate cyclase (GGDEF)-like protein/PAS domain S-box-containing protein